MVDITVTVTDIDMDEAGFIEASFENYDNARISINTPWPKMKLGDTFIYDNEEWAFLSYVKGSKTSCRCARLDVLGGTDTYIQAFYFDYSKRKNGIKFK